jgi:hypothetical protein
LSAARYADRDVRVSETKGDETPRGIPMLSLRTGVDGLLDAFGIAATSPTS